MSWLSELRRKPYRVKRLIAFWSALVLTALIVGAWSVVTVFNGAQPKRPVTADTRDTAPERGSFDQLADAFGDTVSRLSREWQEAMSTVRATSSVGETATSSTLDRSGERDATSSAPSTAATGSPATSTGGSL